MKIISIFVTAILISQTCVSYAQESKNAEELRPRVEMQVQSFLTNKDGTKILQMNAQEGRYRNQTNSSDLTGLWFYTPRDGFAPVKLNFTLKVDTHGGLSLEVTQYASIKTNPSNLITRKEGKIKSQTFVITDFNSISFVNEIKADVRVVTRFTPVYSMKSNPETLTYTPIALKNFLIADNANQVWDQGGSGAGPVMRFENWQGTLYISFIPFKGSAELGTADGRIIELKLSEKITVRLQSEEYIVGPEVIGKVYGWYSNAKRTTSRHASSFGTLSAVNAENEVSKLH